MSLLETIPASLDQALKRQKVGEPAIAVATDLMLDGRFGEEWLIVTDEHLRVYSPDGAAMRLDLPMAKVKMPMTDPLIGGGALIVAVDGETIEVVRYSNACQRKFARVNKHLTDVTKYRDDKAAGKEVKERPVVEPDTDERKRCPTCHLLLPEGTKVCPACLDKGKVILRLAGYLKPYWREATVIWLLMILGSVVGLVPPYLTRPLMDKVLVPTQAGTPLSDRMALLGWLVLGLLLAQIAGQAIGILRGRLLVRVGTALSHDLRVQLYSHLQFLSLRFFDKHPVGAMIARVTQDTQSLESVLVDGMQYFVVNILTLIAIGAVLFVMNWKLTLLVLVPVPIVIFLSNWFWKHVISLWHRYWHYRARLTASVSDSLSGTRVVKAFAKEQEEVDRFTKHSDNLLRSDMEAEQTWTTLFPILWFIASTGSLLVWYFGGRQVLDSQQAPGHGMTLGTLMAFQAYLGAFSGPIQFLSRIADYLARSLTSSERVFEILDSDLEIKDPEDAMSMPSIQGRVEFKNMTFGYEPHKPVLKNINMDVKAGEMIGLVGRSGAGKSTTVNLICRLFDVSQGEILVDGVNIKKIRQKDLRSQIGIVLQDTFLFNGTIAENIGYAKPSASREDIMAAAKAANAHDFIVSKSEGYDTRVGERGQMLSGGERQRVAIARAILHNPRILILDEATASVDTDTEKQIQEAIARMVKGRTTFAIAHRLSTLRNANRVVLLKDGEIAEMGTHAELLEKKGEFSRLVEMQKEMSSVMAVGT
jgi:ATP-binding cassette subfamily B protein